MEPSYRTVKISVLHTEHRFNFSLCTSCFTIHAGEEAVYFCVYFLQAVHPKRAFLWYQRTINKGNHHQERIKLVPDWLMVWDKFYNLKANLRLSNPAFPNWSQDQSWTQARVFGPVTGPGSNADVFWGCFVYRSLTAASYWKASWCGRDARLSHFMMTEVMETCYLGAMSIQTGSRTLEKVSYKLCFVNWYECSACRELFYSVMACSILEDNIFDTL